MRLLYAVRINVDMTSVFPDVRILSSFFATLSNSLCGNESSFDSLVQSPYWSMSYDRQLDVIDDLDALT